MYYQVPKSSPTGQLLTALQERMYAANEEALKLVQSLGAETFRPRSLSIAGGVSSIIFPEGKPDKSELKHWKRGALKGEYMPNERTKKGKELAAKIDKLPHVWRHELNSIVGYKHRWNVCGIQWNKDKDYYLISMMENWEYQIPSDCIELTQSEFKELSKKLEIKEESEVEND